MIVDVIDAAALAPVGSNIVLSLQSMLNMDADQRYDARDLGQHEERQENRTAGPCRANESACSLMPSLYTRRAVKDQKAVLIGPHHV